MTLEQVREIISNGGKVTWNNMEIIDGHILCQNTLFPLEAIGTPAGLAGFAIVSNRIE